MDHGLVEVQNVALNGLPRLRRQLDLGAPLRTKVVPLEMFQIVDELRQEPSEVAPSCRGRLLVLALPRHRHREECSHDPPEYHEQELPSHR